MLANSVCHVSNGQLTPRVPQQADPCRLSQGVIPASIRLWRLLNPIRLHKQRHHFPHMLFTGLLIGSLARADE